MCAAASGKVWSWFTQKQRDVNNIVLMHDGGSAEVNCTPDSTQRVLSGDESANPTPVTGTGRWRFSVCQSVTSKTNRSHKV